MTWRQSIYEVNVINNERSDKNECLAHLSVKNLSGYEFWPALWVEIGSIYSIRQDLLMACMCFLISPDDGVRSENSSHKAAPCPYHRCSPSSYVYIYDPYGLAAFFAAIQLLQNSVACAGASYGAWHICNAKVRLNLKASTNSMAVKKNWPLNTLSPDKIRSVAVHKSSICIC